jgi:hypothetical protein
MSTTVSVQQLENILPRLNLNPDNKDLLAQVNTDQLTYLTNLIGRGFIEFDLSNGHKACGIVNRSSGGGYKLDVFKINNSGVYTHSHSFLFDQYGIFDLTSNRNFNEYTPRSAENYLRQMFLATPPSAQPSAPSMPGPRM